MIKGSIHQEGITIVDTYAPNNEALKYIKQILTYLMGEIDKNTIVEIVEKFSVPFSIMDISSKQIISKKKKKLDLYFRPNGTNRN